MFECHRISRCLLCGIVYGNIPRVQWKAHNFSTYSSVCQSIDSLPLKSDVYDNAKYVLKQEAAVKGTLKLGVMDSR